MVSSGFTGRNCLLVLLRRKVMRSLVLSRFLHLEPRPEHQYQLARISFIQCRPLQGVALSRDTSARAHSYYTSSWIVSQAGIPKAVLLPPFSSLGLSGISSHCTQEHRLYFLPPIPILVTTAAAQDVIYSTAETAPIESYEEIIGPSPVGTRWSGFFMLTMLNSLMLDHLYPCLLDN